MSKMLPWEKTDLPFMLIMDQKSWPLCVIPLSACSAVLVFLPSLLACATTLVIPMLLYKSCPSLLVRTHKPCPKSLNTRAKRALYDNLGSDEQLAVNLDYKIQQTKKDGWRGSKIKEREVRYVIQE